MDLRFIDVPLWHGNTISKRCRRKSFSESGRIDRACLDLFDQHVTRELQVANAWCVCRAAGAQRSGERCLDKVPSRVYLVGYCDKPDVICQQ